MRILTSAAVVAVTVLSPVAAAADEQGEDWRAGACIRASLIAPPGPVEQASASGPSTLVASSREPVEGLPSVQVGVDRLDFSGVTCEVFYIDGALPRDAVLDVAGNEWTATFERALDGRSLGPAPFSTRHVTPTRLYPGEVYDDMPDAVMVLGVSSFVADYSEVMKAGPGTPRSWVGKTLTSVHTGSNWELSLTGTTAVRRDFDRSRTTDRAARTAYARSVALAERTFTARVAKIEKSRGSRLWKSLEIQKARIARGDARALARKKQRLALVGVRLVVRDVASSNRGTLPPAA